MLKTAGPRPARDVLSAAHTPLAGLCWGRKPWVSGFIPRRNHGSEARNCRSSMLRARGGVLDKRARFTEKTEILKGTIVDRSIIPTLFL